MPEGEIAMTREAILKEIQLLPDDMLEAIWNMVKVASAMPQNTFQSKMIRRLSINSELLVLSKEKSSSTMILTSPLKI
jgi:hypothetical protein